MTRCSLLEEAQSTRAAMPNGSWMNGPELLSGDAAGVQRRSPVLSWVRNQVPAVFCFPFHPRPYTHGQFASGLVWSRVWPGSVLSCLVYTRKKAPLKTLKSDIVALQKIAFAASLGDPAVKDACEYINFAADVLLTQRKAYDEKGKEHFDRIFDERHGAPAAAAAPVAFFRTA